MQPRKKSRAIPYKQRPSKSERLIRQYGLQPRHTLGQHFLKNQRVLQREIQLAEILPSDTVLEIGPGAGALTELLLPKAKSVVAIEFDRQFKPCLDALARKYPHLKTIWGDALQVDLPSFERVVANLPYKIALPLIFKLLAHPFERAVLICQERLVKRIAAQPGEPGYSRISVSIQCLARPRMLGAIKRDDFIPPPDVPSAILQLKRRKREIPAPPDDYFRLFLDLVFQRRNEPLNRVLPALAVNGQDKTSLLNALREVGPAQAEQPAVLLTPQALANLALHCFHKGAVVGASCP